MEKTSREELIDIVKNATDEDIKDIVKAIEIVIQSSIKATE